MRKYKQKDVRAENARRHAKTKHSTGTKHGVLKDYDPFEGHEPWCAIRIDEYGACDCGCNAEAGFEFEEFDENDPEHHAAAERYALQFRGKE